MTTQQARAMLIDANAEFSSIVEAAATIAKDSASTIDDLLNCLDHGGLAAEFAALELYRRNGIPLPNNPV